MSDHPIVAQATDNSILNTEPVLVKSTVVGIVGAVAAILLLGGWITPEEKAALETNAGVIVPAVIVILQIVGAIWARMSAYAPKTAAKIAIESAARGRPVMSPPP